MLTLGDGDVADAAAAMAATLEAAGNGVIAELPGGNPVSEGLRRKMDAFLAEVGKGGGSRFGRDAAAVLRGVERGARHEAPGRRRRSERLSHAARSHLASVTGAISLPGGVADHPALTGRSHRA